MSLLMQALKKAERAKQNSLQEEDADKPSAAFDEPPAPAAELSLAPLDETPAPAALPARPHEPLMEPLRTTEYGLEAMPALIPATEAIHDPTPPQSRIEPASAGAGAAAAPRAAAGARQAESAAARVAGESRPPARTTAEGAAAPSSGAAARARAAARTATSDDKASWDPARIRVAALSGIMLLILALFAYLYWQATSAPGAGAGLPRVPMPPPGAGSTTPAIIVPPPPGGGDVPYTAQPPVASYDAAQPQESQPQAGAAAPALGARMPSEDDIQRQLEQAAAQQAQPSPQQPLQQPKNQQPQQPAGVPRNPAAAAPDGIAAADIRVRRSSVAPTISPPLQNGYAAYQAGDMAAAAQHYDTALRQDPNSRDALLGAAAVAVRQHDGQQANAIYLRLLDLDPNDPDALAGLIGLRPGDSGQSELRLKAILQKAPDSGPALFALGNLYARQNRWPEAQQIYFRAYTANPDNADYAFNLAVGLDRLNQGKLALGYYQRALALAGPANNSGGGFDRNAVQTRIQQLAAAHGAVRH